VTFKRRRGLTTRCVQTRLPAPRIRLCTRQLYGWHPARQLARHLLHTSLESQPLRSILLEPG
jgi:hypothetical protein